MGSSKFEMNLPTFFEKKTIGDFNLDEKLFEFSDYLLIDKCDFNAHLVIEKKNTFWQLDIKVNGFEGNMDLQINNYKLISAAGQQE